MSNKYIPIETSEFHRDPKPEHKLTAVQKLRKHLEDKRRRAIDEAYNPKHYQTYKAKQKAAKLAAQNAAQNPVDLPPKANAPLVSPNDKKHQDARDVFNAIEAKAAAHPEKIAKLKELKDKFNALDSKAFNDPGNGELEADANSAYEAMADYKSKLKDDGIIHTFKQKNDKNVADKYFDTVKQMLAIPVSSASSSSYLNDEDKKHQEAIDTFNAIEAKAKLHPDKTTRLKTLYNKYEALDGGSGTGAEANAAYEEWSQYKKTLHDNGILPTLTQKLANSKAIKHFADKKSVADIVGHTPSTPAAPAKKLPNNDILVMLTKLDKLRTAMTNSSYGKEQTAEYDKEKEKLKALGYLPQPVPGKNWVAAYHHHLNPSETPATPAANPFALQEPEKHQGTQGSDPDPDEWESLDTKLASHYPKHEKGYDSHIHKYTRSSADLNETMRSGTKDTEAHHLKKVDSLHKELSGHAAPETFHVYTGVPYSPQDLHKKHFGVENTDKTSIKVHTKAFTSTSIRKGIARNFAKTITMPDGSRIKHVLRIKIPKDSAHGKYVAHESNYPHEKEFILNHGKNLNIHPVPEIKKIGGGKWDKDIHVHYWDATIEPDNTPNKVAAAKAKAHPAITSAAPTPAPTAAPAHFNPSAPAAHSAAPALGTKHKAEAVKAEYGKNPNATAHAIAKAVSSHGQMTYANAYYLANKLKKAHAG
jgi:hypothetical protein